MKSISLCMIVKNEEEVIGRCLESVKDIVDEIIIVDTGSTDNTKKIVSKYTNKIYDFEWKDDFAAARNFSFSKATKDYIIWLDADDIILEEDRNKLKQLKLNMDGTVDVYMLKYNYYLDSKGQPLIVQNRERIFKRNNNYKWVSPIHEVIIPWGNIKNEDISITHKKEKIKDPKRNLRILKKAVKENSQDIRLKYCYAKELLFSNKIEDAIVQYEKFINSYYDDYNTNSYLLYPALLELSECYNRKELEEKEFRALMMILYKQKPKSECLTRIGNIFLKRQQYEIAKYWYELALNSNEPEENKDFEKFLPSISVGVCYYWIGDIEKAKEFNEFAGNIKPYDDTYIKNKEIYNLHKIDK